MYVDDPCYIVYAGPWPSSELETQAVTSFVLRRRESLAAFMTMHNYGQMLLTRWAHSANLYPPEHNETVREVLYSCQLAITTTIRMQRQ